MSNSVKTEILSSENLTHLKIFLGGEKPFQMFNPHHLKVIIAALTENPIVDGVIVSSIKDTLITGRGLKFLQELADVRRDLITYKNLKPSGESGLRPNQKCLRCPQNPSKIFTEVLDDFEKNPLSWEPLPSSYPGKGLKECDMCIKRNRRLLLKLKRRYKEVFERFELL